MPNISNSVNVAPRIVLSPIKKREKFPLNLASGRRQTKSSRLYDRRVRVERGVWKSVEDSFTVEKVG